MNEIVDADEKRVNGRRRVILGARLQVILELVIDTRTLAWIIAHGTANGVVGQRRVIPSLHQLVNPSRPVAEFIGFGGIRIAKNNEAVGRVLLLLLLLLLRLHAQEDANKQED